MAKSRNVTGSDEIEFPVRYCTDHTNQEIRMYCSDHKCFGCGECMLFHHKLCKHEYITEAAERFEDSGEFAKFLEEIEDIEVTRTECQNSITTLQERANKMMKDLEMVDSDIKSLSTGIKPEENIYKRFMLTVDMGPKMAKIREAMSSIEYDVTFEEPNTKSKDLSSVSTSLDKLTVNTPGLKGKTNVTPSQTKPPSKSKVQQLATSDKVFFKQPKYNEKSDHEGSTQQRQKDDDLVLETFYHRSGKEFQCLYESGIRFYLEDCDSKEWQPFPKKWYNEGLLMANTILKKENGNPDNTRNNPTDAKPRGTVAGGGSDDREGFLMHPTRGRIPTYIFYKKHNVHMYFDRDTESWTRMPIGWELHHTMVKSLVDEVEKAVPTWRDRHDILSLLRACNYVPDECINIYLHLQKDEWMKMPKTATENKLLVEKKARITELEKTIQQLKNKPGAKGAVIKK